jgi:hypothetical protein
MFAVTFFVQAAASAVFFSHGPHFPQWEELPMPVSSEQLGATVAALTGGAPSQFVQSANAKVVVFEGLDHAAAQGKPHVLALPYAESYVPADSAVFADSHEQLDQILAAGLPAVLVVRFDPEQALKKVEQHTAEFIALAHQTQPRRLAAPAEAAPEIVVPKINATPALLSGLMATFVWLIIFFSGTCCLFNLQVPDQFTDKCLALNKEY